MKIGITGYRGFIGNSVAQYLVSQGFQVISLDAYTRSNMLDRVSPDTYPDDLDWILHFGASTSIPKSFADPITTYRNNLDATLSALNIAYRSNAAFVYMSSYVYGKLQYLPVDEKHPVEASNPYAGSKILCEEICRQLSELLNIPVIILRGFNVYGDCHISGRLIADLLESVRKNTPIVINDPLPKRDYLYIRDFYTLITSIISKMPIITGTYNVGYGRSYSNIEVAEMVRHIAKEKRPISIRSQPRRNDILDCFANVTLIKETFSWKPFFTLEMGLTELITNIKNK